MPIEPRQIVPLSACAYGFDVRVRPDARRYDARTIIRMVKLVNRRGMVRYVQSFEGSKGETVWGWWTKPEERIPNYNEHEEWVDDALYDPKFPGVLYVCFSDRFEARRFACDLEALRQTKLKRGPKPRKQEVGKPAPQL